MISATFSVPCPLPMPRDCPVSVCTSLVMGTSLFYQANSFKQQMLMSVQFLELQWGFREEAWNYEVEAAACKASVSFPKAQVKVFWRTQAFPMGWNDGFCKAGFPKCGLATACGS